MHILVSPEALAELRAAKEKDTQYYRIGVTPGGCSGFKYSLVFAEEIEEEDYSVPVAEDIILVVDPFSGQYLDGVSLGYEKTLTAAGFIFTNPHATGGCGCGTSFSA